jgi:hypothetical protein
MNIENSFSHSAPLMDRIKKEVALTLFYYNTNDGDMTRIWYSIDHRLTDTRQAHDR